MDLARQLEMEEKLKQEMARCWAEYQAAPPSERAESLKQYLEALRRFTKAIRSTLPIS
jgi:hypothetical protein